MQDTGIEIINKKNRQLQNNLNCKNYVLYQTNNNKKNIHNNDKCKHDNDTHDNDIVKIYKYSKLQMEREYNLLKIDNTLYMLNATMSTNIEQFRDNIPLCELVPLGIVKRQLLMKNKQKID